MNGVDLAIRFSTITNSLGFCGPKRAPAIFARHIEHHDREEEAKECLCSFEALHPYFSVIAAKSGLDLFDYRVVEAYWIGNDLLDSFTREDNIRIVEGLVQRGLPRSIGASLISEMPLGLVPHHNFNVMYVGVGKITGSVPTTVQNMDNCRTSWGEVAEVMRTQLIVTTRVLRFQNGCFVLGEREAKTVVYNPKILGTVAVGDTVAIHWGFACVVLSKEQIGCLEHYTHKILDAVNSHRLLHTSAKTQAPPLLESSGRQSRLAQ